MSDLEQNSSKTILTTNTTSDLLQELIPSEAKDSSSDKKTALRELISKCIHTDFNPSQLSELVQDLLSADNLRQHYGIIGIRKIVSTGGPSIQAIIDQNLIPKLVEFMENDEQPQLQLEAAWILANVASGSSKQTKVIINSGAVPCFIKLLSKQDEISDQAVWAFGNIAGDSAKYRDFVLKSGALDPLIRFIENTESISFYRTGIWTLSNLCRGTPLPDFDLVKNAIPTFCKALRYETDMQTLSEAAWSLSSLTDTIDPMDGDSLLEVIPALLKNLNETLPNVALPCLRALGNLTMEDERLSKVLEIPEYLPKLFQMMESGVMTLRREACWIISNQTAGDAKQVDDIMKNPYYVDIILSATTDTLEVRQQAVWILTNALEKGNCDTVMLMIEWGVGDCLLNLLSEEDEEVVITAISGLLKLISNDELKENELLRLLEDKAGRKRVEQLQYHRNAKIKDAALKILRMNTKSQRIV